MKVREEVDALKTMGLDPVGFLVVPRVTAATANAESRKGQRGSTPLSATAT